MEYTGKTREETKLAAALMNKMLCNYNVHYQKLRSFHWNVTGPHFFQLHNFFEEKYNEAKKDIDDIAERILVLQLMPISSMSAYLERAEIKESPENINPKIMMEKTLEDTATLIQNCRDIIKAASDAHDEGTIDLIASILSRLEKNTWMIEAWKSDLFADVYNTQQLVN